jgi:hypothetical protein
VLAALVLAAVLGLSGCGRLGTQGSSSSQVATPTASTTTSATATGTAPGAQTPASGTEPAVQDGNQPGATEPISASDAKAIDAELSAIQSELDRLSVPSDDDFDSIGSGLE